MSGGIPTNPEPTSEADTVVSEPQKESFVSEDVPGFEEVPTPSGGW
jgi:hypothetical protein